MATARTGAPALLGGALLLAGVAAGPAAAAPITSCGALVTAPGTYVLVNDLNCPGGDAIRVAANNVNLVLAGHTLTAATGVTAQNVTGLKITGGTIVAFSSGILLVNTPDALVTGVTATGGTNGIFLLNTTGARLAGNTAT